MYVEEVIVDSFVVMFLCVVFKFLEYMLCIGIVFVVICVEVLLKGLVGVVNGVGDVGGWLVDEVDVVMFIGLVLIGCKVAVRVVECLILMFFELGGKDVVLVLVDCDVECIAIGVV